METDSGVRIEYMPLSRLKRWPRNPKDHDIGAIIDSLVRFGMVRSPVLDESTGRLVLGNGTLDALQQMKLHCPAIYGVPDRIEARGNEWYIPIQRGISFESEAEAEAYVVTDNRSTERGGWNEPLLLQVLSDQAAADKLAGTGFDRDDLDGIMHYLYPVEPYVDPALDGQAAELDGYQDFEIRVVVPVRYGDAVIQWLANGEALTGPGLGKGVLKRCGLL